MTLLGQTAASSSPTSAASAPAAPIIELNGNATSTIDVGSSCNDLGARIIAPESDINLGIITVLDGATTTAVSVDTSVPGTHTILYTVTDPQGLTGSTERSVIVATSVQATITAASSTPPQDPANDNATTATTSSSAAI